MTWFHYIAALVGIASGLVFALSALRAFGELMHQWADEPAEEVVPPADHPYEPNGGARGASLEMASQHYPAEVLYPPPYFAGPRRNGTLPGRRKDNTHDRIDADPSTLPN